MPSLMILIMAIQRSVFASLQKIKEHENGQNTDIDALVDAICTAAALHKAEIMEMYTLLHNRNLILDNEFSQLKLDIDASLTCKPVAKGEYNGECYRSICENKHAVWWHFSNRKFYCEECARMLNMDPCNHQEALALYGHELLKKASSPTEFLGEG